MAAVSQKKIYEKQVYELLRTVNVNRIMWGEDLLDKKITIFSGRIMAIPGYYDIKSRLIIVALLYFNPIKQQPIRFVTLNYDPVFRVVFMPESNFNAMWKYLRNSIDIGIRLHRENGIKLSINHPQDIVDVSNLNKQGYVANINDKGIAYEASPEKMKAMGRKQSMLDNLDNRYFYGSHEEVYHDKECECVRAIAPDGFMASEFIPEGRVPCQKCRRKILLRELCSPYNKAIPIVDAYMSNFGISDRQLEKYAYVYKFKLWIGANNELMLKCREDTWFIKGFKNRHLVLWHNNYSRINEHERLITEGFHKQGVEGWQLFPILEYINSYEFEKHNNVEKSTDIAEVNGYYEQNMKHLSEQACAEYGY